MNEQVGTTRMEIEPMSQDEKQMPVSRFASIEHTMAEGKQAQVITTIAPAKMTLAEVRAKLEGKTGKRF